MQAKQGTSQLHHLPQQVTSFVGREQALKEIARRLVDPNCRLLTIVGAGGIGKTRLAIQATAVAAANFRNGAFFVNLQPIQSDAFLLTAVADTFRHFTLGAGIATGKHS